VNVPFLDVAAGYRELRAEFDAAYARVMDSGRYVLGEELEDFEHEFATLTQSEHAVGVGNGLDALTIALRAHDVGPGDEVIVPAHTFIATWLAVNRCGATVVPVDVDPVTLLIDPAAAAAAVTPRTVAIVPVHLYGHPADLPAVGALAERHGLVVVEDAAQAHGASLGGRSTGSLGHAGAFSFYPAKNLGAFGDGGALTTDDAAVANRARRLRNYGSTRRGRHDELGENSRLDPLQAAFLRVKMAALQRWNARRKAVARAYLEGLADVPEVVLPPAGGDGVDPVWHLFCVRHPHRDELAAELHSRGVATQVHYPVPPHRSQAFAGLNLGAGAFPITEAATATLLSLPIGPHLDEAGVETVIEAVRGFPGA
jgi:dTDP-3-amino-3,4,6-trideoxy-alpha-D-glucose transaminase